MPLREMCMYTHSWCILLKLTWEEAELWFFSFLYHHLIIWQRTWYPKFCISIPFLLWEGVPFFPSPGIQVIFLPLSNPIHKGDFGISLFTFFLLSPTLEGLVRMNCKWKVTKWVSGLQFQAVGQAQHTQCSPLGLFLFSFSFFFFTHLQTAQEF